MDESIRWLKLYILPLLVGLVRPIQSPETRRFLALILVVWGLSYQFVTIAGTVSFTGSDAAQTAHVLGALFLACGVGLIYTINGRRATWRGRFIAIIALGVMVSMAMVSFQGDRVVLGLTCLMLTYGLLGEVLVVDDH